MFLNNPKEAKKPTGLTGLLRIAFHSFEKQLNRDLEKYNRVLNRNIENGKKGGRPQNFKKGKTQKNPKKGDSDSDSDSDSVSDSVSEDKESVEKKPKRFIPPTLEEIETFIKTNNLNVNAKYFLDYFTDGNWIDSKGNKVKNWKQKLRTWHNHNDSKPKYRTLADSNREAMDAYEKRFSNDVIEGEVCEP